LFRTLNIKLQRVIKMFVKHRLDDLRTFMGNQGISAVVIANPDNQYYLSGFKALLYSRPILLIIEEQDIHLIVPALEEVHAQEKAKVDQLLVYYEQPEKASLGISPLQHLKSLLSRNKAGSTIGVDMAYAPAETVDFIRGSSFEIKDISRKIVEMRYVKDEQELKLIREAGRLANLAVGVSLNACREGITEIEMDAVGNDAVFKETAQTYPNATLDLLAISPSGVERTIMPHVFSNTRRFRRGDVIIHSRQVALNGYRAELERTIVLGHITYEQRKGFEAARLSQQVALDFIKPGVTAAQVDEVSREILVKAGYADYAIHRVGHGIGISDHEEPYLRFDNQLVLQKGMVFTIEPGIFIPQVSGFRHSDTVILTDNGSELVTDYPKDLESLTYN
jgi:Xaa-Pro dipeptidase